MISVADFIRHVTKHGCEVNPMEGGNLTGVALDIYNPKKRIHYILTIYKGGMISDTTVKEACCMRLFIDTP